LINPNRFQNPAVIPVGLEYLLTYLRSAGHEVEILDLCFSTDPFKDLRTLLKKKTYDIHGVTIRNIDSALYFKNEFFLNEIRKIIELLKTTSNPIVVGGSGFSAMPEDILEYLNADFGIVGPGEVAFLKLLEDLQQGTANYRIINGWEFPIGQLLTHERGTDFNYQKYLEKQGIAGFETQKGCPRTCCYCIEANTGRHEKLVPAVVEEIKNLVNRGCKHFHACDSEFNLNLRHSIEFCKALIAAELDMKWTLYMKPTPVSEELFHLLKKSNAYLITCSIESDVREQKKNNYDYDDLKFFIDCCKKEEIMLAMDLLIGFPDEPKDSVERMISFLRENRPDSVGVNFYFRLYGNTEITRLIKERKDLQDGLSRPLKENENFLEPIFYNGLSIEYVQQLIGDDDIFRIEGLEAGVNYQRINQKKDEM
ncbi:MAG: B12-binding domain-containing radical SAM protein, partial [Candidatus Helarchaeales archaeon]